MALIPDRLRHHLLANGIRNQIRRATGEVAMDHRPLMKLFCPWSDAVWLLSELDPDDPDLAFGLCDYGLGCPAFNTVRISGLESLHGPSGRQIERDLGFHATKALAGYAAEARIRRRIVC